MQFQKMLSNMPQIQRLRNNITTYFTQANGNCDTGELSTHFSQLSTIWVAISKLIRQYADKVEMSLAAFAILYYRRWPAKALYAIGVLANLCWLRHYLGEVTSENGDRLTAGTRFRCGYSVIKRLIKLEGRMNIHIPIIGTFRFDARFDSMDHQDNTFAKALTSVNNLVIPNYTTTTTTNNNSNVTSTTIIENEEEINVEELDVEEDQEEKEFLRRYSLMPSKKELTTMEEEEEEEEVVDEVIVEEENQDYLGLDMLEEKEEEDPFRAWRSSFDHVVPEIANTLEWRRESLARDEWRESLESVVSQIEELKPYLQAEEEIYHLDENNQEVVKSWSEDVENDEVAVEDVNYVERVGTSGGALDFNFAQMDVHAKVPIDLVNDEKENTSQRRVSMAFLKGSPIVRRSSGLSHANVR